MKKMLMLIAPLCLILMTAVFSTAAEKVEAPDSCSYCGMNRTMFAHSRMLVKYDDGSSTGTCSLHCTAVELATHIDKNPVVLQVGAYDSKKLIDAESAVWVIGGDKPGVMSARAKWAFADRSTAEAFIKAHQGSLGSFDDAIRASYEDMYLDTKMIRERRAAKRLKQQHAH